MVALKPNKDLVHFNELFVAGKLAPVIHGSFELRDIREAIRLLGSGDHRGKIVITMA